MKKPKPKLRGPKSIPSQVNISGGITLKAMPFKIVAHNDDGSPKLFELQPADVAHDMRADGACVLFAQEEWIRAPQPDKAKAGDSGNADPIGLHSMVEGNRSESQT